ncbi:PilZ domain-containing protein [Sphingomonas gellani]|uniref:PilZ domain-containing protein n=1 Tax=Sphingomonas gellani TaxID=1166340 RepID=A0A1H7ZPC3_9SPHN|nr:PilZ domain-containing protein [Sphingomonas gellani]SEM60146.1 PilZ domain-containing protein [Sphingomonas gellani]
MLAAEFEPAEPGRRRFPRAPVSLHVGMDNSGLDRALCKVIDLSVHGCRIQTYSELERGSTIWLMFAGLPPCVADVRWSANFIAGCEFRKLLSQRSFDHLMKLDAMAR